MQKPEFQLQIPRNPNNPYDYLGQNHNYLIGVLYENYESEIEAISDLNQRQSFIMDKTQELIQMFFQQDVNVRFLDDVPTNPGLYSDIDFGAYATILGGMTNLSATDRSTLVAFFDRIIPMPVESAIDVANALYSACQFENDFLRDDGNLTNSTVLGAIAIAKYSLYRVETEVPEPQMRIKWWHALADPCGAIAGGLLGGPGGIISGALAGTSIYEKCTQ